MPRIEKLNEIHGSSHWLKNTAILVIDEEEISRMLKAVLTREGARVSVANSVDEGLELFRRIVPQVIVSDVRSRIRSGSQLIRTVREHNRKGSRNIAIVALTDLYAGVDEQDGVAHGFDAYLSKPFEPSELVALIGSVLEKQSSGPQDFRLFEREGIPPKHAA